MAEIQTIRRNLALKEYEVKESPDGKQTIFSIRFVMDIPVMLTPSPVMLTPIKDDGLREL